MAFCAACGTNLASSPFCTNCGTAAGEAQAPASTPQPAAPKAEQCLLEEAGLFISTSRFVAGTQTYAMSGITSVGTTAEQPSRMGAVLAILFGAFLALIGLVTIAKGGFFVLLIGGAIMALGVWSFSKKVPIHYVVLHSASGEQKATKSTDGDLIQRIVAAINQAIVLRG